MKALKKAWIFLLLVCLAALFSTTALADDNNIKSGTCGDNLTWTLNTDTGALTISGTGEMTSAPWRSYTVRSVTIGNGVTTIGEGAFEGCTNLTSVTIGNSVTSIGNYAFYGCTGLTSVTIPDSVTSIGRLAFYGCTGLTSAGPIGGGYSYEFGWTASIPNYAFYGCTGLTSVTIPDSVASIGSYAFEECTNLTSVTIPDSVTDIGGYAFERCTNLTSVAIPDSVTSIGANAFSYCSRLTNVTIPDSVTSIGGAAFYKCSRLTSVVIPDSVTSIDASTFCQCSSLTSVTIPDSVTSIGDSAFSYCSSLASVTVPDSVTSIGGGAFCGTAYYNDSKNWENSVLYIDHWLIEAKSNISGNCAIKSGTIGVSAGAFSGCGSLTSVTIPVSVMSIGANAFSGCSSLTSVTIPDSVTSIGANAFYNTAYYNDSTNWENSVLYIDHWLIDAESDISGNYVIKSGTIGFSAGAFSGCSSLTSVTIPDSVTSIGTGAFYGCTSLTDVYYGGSEAEWNAITIGNNNDYLTSATIHYTTTDADDEPVSTATTPGDLTGDGEVDASDLTVLARHVGKVETMEDETYLANADVTGDGNVDASDLTKLAQYVGKIISSLD